MCVAGVDARLINFLQRFVSDFWIHPDTCFKYQLGIWEFSASLQTADVCCVCVCISRRRRSPPLAANSFFTAPPLLLQNTPRQSSHLENKKTKMEPEEMAKNVDACYKVRKHNSTRRTENASQRHVKPKKKKKKRRLRAVRCIIESHRDTRLCICLSAFRMDLEMGLP